MNKRQKAILIGMILGDAYLQKTGAKNCRIRLEHSSKQKDYLLWKGKELASFFQGSPKVLTRYNPIYKKSYSYCRWQSNASPVIGKYQQIFYQQGKKIIPDNLNKLLTDSLSLAVWFMDDGYFYHRDKMAYIYLPNYSDIEKKILLETLKSNFLLSPVLKIKKRGEKVLVFSVSETKKLFSLIEKYIIASMQYKLLNPVSTEA